MTLPSVRLPDGRIWLRVTDPEWADPLSPFYAAEHGGRWNAPSSYPTLYLNADLTTARLQIRRLLAGSPVHPDDLDDRAYVLVAATLPRDQTCADATTPAGLRALGLPGDYPRDSSGADVDRSSCQRAGARVQREGLRGVWCISAASEDRSGRELAWFPATRRSVARPLWDEPLPFGGWRDASGWSSLALEPQPEPKAD